jgi:hypothetical protein
MQLCKRKTNKLVNRLRLKNINSIQFLFLIMSVKNGMGMKKYLKNVIGVATNQSACQKSNTTNKNGSATTF